MVQYWKSSYMAKAIYIYPGYLKYTTRGYSTIYETTLYGVNFQFFSSEIYSRVGITYTERLTYSSMVFPPNY